MSTTLSELRQDIGREMQECMVVAITSAATGSFVSTELQSSIGDDRLLQNGYVKLGGESLRIASYTASTGTVTLDRSLDDVPTGNAEIHTIFPTDEMDDAINHTLPRCMYYKTVEIDTSDGELEYSLAAYTWLARPAQVFRAEWVVGDTDDEYRYAKTTDWDIYEADNVLTLRLMRTRTDQLNLVCVSPYAELAADAGTTDCPADWVRAGAKTYLYNLKAGLGTNDSTKAMEKQRSKAAAEYDSLTARYSPRRAPQIRSPRWF